MVTRRGSGFSDLPGVQTWYRWQFMMLSHELWKTGVKPPKLWLVLQDLHPKMTMTCRCTDLALERRLLPRRLLPRRLLLLRQLPRVFFRHAFGYMVVVPATTSPVFHFWPPTTSAQTRWVVAYLRTQCAFLACIWCLC